MSRKRTWNRQRPLLAATVSGKGWRASCPDCPGATKAFGTRDEAEAWLRLHFATETHVSNVRLTGWLDDVFRTAFGGPA